MGTRRNKFLNRENLDRLLSENRGKLTLDAIFNLLNSDLEDAYGHPIDWQEIINPTGNPADLLQGYLDDAINGDGPHGEIIWQTVLHQSFDMVREIYLNLTMEDRRRFDRITPRFFSPMPRPSRPSMLKNCWPSCGPELSRSSNWEKNTAWSRMKPTNGFDFIYRDRQGKRERDTYQYVVNARGQEKSLETNPSALAGNLLQSGTVQIEEIRSV